MKKRKRIMVIGLIGACMLSVSACGVQSTKENTTEVVKEDKKIETVQENSTETFRDTSKESAESSEENQEQESTIQEESLTEDGTEEKNTEQVNSDGVNPELKEALDAYEEFFNGYVEFMKKYQKASAEEMITLMGDYAEYMLQYADMMQKIQNIQSEDLSTQDAAYYIEVTARINQKLLTVAE